MGGGRTVTVADLVDTLADQGVELWSEGSRLRFRAPQGTLTDELRSALSGQKEAILDLLRTRGSQTYRAFPLSYEQQAFWFLNRNHLDSPAYNVGFTARILSSVDVATLHEACQILVDRHPMLRTVYALGADSAPEQHIYDYRPVFFQAVDARAWDEAALAEAVQAAYIQPFDLENGPLIRFTLFTQADERHVLLLSAYHIAVDGWSVWLLMDEMGKLYATLRDSQFISLPRPDADYTDYVRWQRQMLESERGDRLWNFWQERLADALAPLDLPTDRPRSGQVVARAASYRFAIDPKLTARVEDFSRRETVTPYVVLLSVFQLLLHRYSGQEDFVIGTPAAGRSQTQFETVVGEFVNSLVLRTHCDPTLSFRSFLQQVRQDVLDAIAHQDYPLALLIQKLHPQRYYGRSTLFQVDFVLQKPQEQSGSFASLFSGGEGAQIDFGGLLMEYYYMNQQEGQLDLTLEIVEGDGLLLATFKYNADLFDRTTIERMAGHYRKLLESAVTQADSIIGTLPLLTEAERESLVATAPAGETLDILSAFETQAARHPVRTAVIDAAGRLSYGELDRRANQLAHYLQQAGVGSETIVGVYLPRSNALITALLAVWKAGGAYLPIDPNTPPARIAYMLRDSQAHTLITLDTLDAVPLDETIHVIRLDRDSVAQMPELRPGI